MPTTLFRNASEVLTFATGGTPKRGPELADPGLIPNGAVAIRDGTIVAAGPEAEVLASLDGEVEEIDVAGRVVMPGFVDPHTHAIFAGSRADEFEARFLGTSFLSTLQGGGGIYRSARVSAQASDDELIAATIRRFDRFVQAGTTTVEVKSGYGLTVAEELRHLRIVKQAMRGHPIRVVATVLPLHAVPLAHLDEPDRWVDDVIENLLPVVAEEELATGCDVHIQPGVFEARQCKAVLAAGRRFGLYGHVHADQVEWTGGAELAAETGSLSADHLGYASDAGIRGMAAAGTVAVLIPGSTMFVPDEQPAPARSMVDAGVPIAISTDFNPGSSPIIAMSLVASLSCSLYRLSAAEVLAAATINAACAINMQRQVGSLEAGKQADLIVVEAEDYREIPYRFGDQLVRDVYISGTHVASSPPIGGL